MKSNVLRVLLVNEDHSDQKQIEREMCLAGFEAECRVVQTEAEYEAHLLPLPDLVVSDYSLSQFHALLALELLRERSLEVPFIIVSETIGEEKAVEAIRLGATDFLLKDSLSRLGSMVGNALEKRRQQETERQTRAALRANEERYHALADYLPQIIWVARDDGAIEYLNRRAMEYSGLGLDRLAGWSWKTVIHPEDWAHTDAVWREVLRSGVPCDLEFRIRRVDGEYRWHYTRQVPIRDAVGTILSWLGTCTDIHDLKMTFEQRLICNTSVPVAQTPSPVRERSP